MIKEFLTDTLEFDKFLENDNLFIGDHILNINTLSIQELREKKDIFGRVRAYKSSTDFSSLERINIVVESLIGNISIDKLCYREKIQRDVFFQWKDSFLEAFREYSEDFLIKQKISKTNKDLILKETSDSVYSFFCKYVKENSKNLVIPKSEKLSAFSSFYAINNVFILKKMNNFRKINKHLENVNQKLPLNGIFMGCFETFNSRAQRKAINKVPVLKDLFFCFDFIFNRVFPKLPYFKKLYFQFTKGNNRLLSKAEALGRLVSCGFDILEYKEIDGVHYYVVKKVKEPSYDMNASYGPLFKMRRVGKNGKIIGVYKFRTMHPYSEYLQDYILKLNGYSETGKPANDFRLVPWGKFLRRYWLDELPQIINVFKGELKLVGARPVSQSYFNNIPKEIQELRLKHKPGCIPPYVALDRKSSVDSVLQSEKEYLEEKIKYPYFTDTRYFFKTIYNIVFKNKRSA